MKFFSAALSISAFIANAYGADYSAGFSVNTQASHNDNIRLQSDKTAVNKYSLSPKLILGVETETDKLNLVSGLDFNQYNKSEFNSNDQNISLALSHQFENSSLNLSGTYIHNSTLTSETLTSGRIGLKADRAENYTISPSWIYTFNETNLVQLSATHEVQNYGNTQYIGYKNSLGELDWIHLLTERLKLVTAAVYSDYRSDDIPIDIVAFGFLPLGRQSYSTHTQTKDLQIGADYQLSENSLLSGRIGKSRNDSTQPVKDLDNVCINGVLALVGGAICETLPHAVNFGSTAQLNWKWIGERQQIDLKTTKATQPTSNGYTVDAIQLGANWSYRLTELDKISANLSAVRNRAIDKKNSLLNTSIADRNYGSAMLQYQHQITEYWFFNTSFTFSEQKYLDTDYQANAKIFSIGVLYQPTQWHWSR